MKNLGYETLVVSHSAIQEEGLRQLEKVACGIILKENFGYDFFAWRQGLDLCADNADLENLLLTNDSVIGPFSDMRDIFSSMNEKYDFWGLTENNEHKYHIQSYFLHANKKAIKTETWVEFWDDLKLFESKLDIVRNYEVNLTQTLLQNTDLKIGAWIQTKDLTEKCPPSWFADYPKNEFWYGVSNPTVRFWKELLQCFQFPFIKKNLFFDKEHYHIVQDSNVYEYQVFPINWKKIIERNFSPDSVSLVEEYITDYNISTTKLQHYLPEKYKLLFVFDQFKEPAQTDYLIRLLQFFNAANVETEVIVSSSEDLLDEKTKTTLRDLASLTFFADLNSKQINIHQYQLATEKIGMIIIGDSTAAKFAAKFAYINCPYVLMINNGIPDIDYLKRYGLDVHKEGIQLMTHSKTIHELLIRKGFANRLLDPVILPEIQQAAPSRCASAFNIGFTGLSSFELHREHIVNMAGLLEEKGGFGFFLLFKPAEYSHFKDLFKKNNEVYQAFLPGGRYKILVSEEADDIGEDNNIDLFISYDKPGYLSKAYSDIFAEKKLLLTCFSTAVNKEIFGDAEELFMLEYFNIPGMVKKIAALKDDETGYASMVKQQWEAFEQYVANVHSPDADHFFFREVIDFSELKSLSPKISVIFHFHFYSFDETSFLYYKKRLREFYKPNVDFLFSVTEDSHEIPRHIKSLKRAFPNSVVKLVPNKGRDIGAKFILLDYFIRRGGDSEYVVILHDKKSLHLPYSEARAWIDSLLRIIDPRYYKSIVSKLSKEEKTGIIGSSERVVDCILRYEGYGQAKRPVFEWNNDLLHYMISLYDIYITDYNFIGGTMFWVKGSLLKELNDKYFFLNEYSKLEEGNVMDNNGSTITHCWERLFCWLSTNSGYQVSSI